MTPAFTPLRPTGILALAAGLGLLVGLTGAYVPGEPEPRPNLLVNPSMEIDQLNEGASVTLTSAAAGATIVDEWKAAFTSTGHSPNAAVSCARSATAPAGFADSLKCTTGTGASAVGSGDYLIVYQPIEANQLVNLGLGASGAVTVCASWWQQASIAGYVYGVSLTNFAGTRSYPQIFASSGTANTWQPVSACFPLDTAGSWVTSGASGSALLAFIVAAGSTYQGTGASWNAGNYYGTSALSNSGLTTAGFTFLVTGVKLEASPVPTAYLRRDVAAEIALAQRYFEKSPDIGTALGTVGNNGVEQGVYAVGAAFVGSVRFKVTKRAPPSVTTWSDNTGSSGKIYDATGAADLSGSTLDRIGTNGFRLSNTAVNSGHVYEFHWSADSRL